MQICRTENHVYRCAALYKKAELHEVVKSIETAWS